MMDKAMSSSVEVLFADVQLQHVFADQKTFADAVPLQPLEDIAAQYILQKDIVGFSLKEFVSAHFSVARINNEAVAGHQNIEEYILTLWDALLRVQNKDSGSLMALPYPYIAPGGRFNELYYWDTYFTMLGLAACNRMDIVEGMVNNFTHLINTVGFIPNANRRYYLTRSQPPFYASMVQLLAEAKGEYVVVQYLPALEKEYAFWMKDSHTLTDNESTLHVVKMQDGSLLNRYWDTENTPRPEGYAIDVAIKEQRPDNEALYRNIRAACESGWDFSSRWLNDEKNLYSICTTEIIPVDLNCMMLHLEKTILKAYTYMGNEKMMDQYTHIVEQRSSAIEKYLWCSQSNVYKDYHFKNRKHTPTLSMAMAFPLYMCISSRERAKPVLDFMQQNMLLEGGLLTTTCATEHQWDAPKGWAPLQWIGFIAAKNYHDEAFAAAIRKNWMSNVERRYADTGKLMEKYPVVDKYDGKDTGGEYPNQDGFGWTNGVYLKMYYTKD